MSPSLSWIDPGELKETLSRIGFRADAERPESPAPAFAESGRPAPAPAAPIPTPAAPVAEPRAPAPSPPSFEPLMSVSERVLRLADWLDALTGGAPHFLADPEGLPIYTRGMAEPSALASVALDRALRPVRGLLGTQQVGAAALELDGGRVIHTIWVSTPGGRAALGLRLDGPLDPPRVEAIREALRRVFDW